LNLGPAGYEPAALTGLSYGPFAIHQASIHATNLTHPI